MSVEFIKFTPDLQIVTPDGFGQFVGYDSLNQKVIVEMDYKYLVEYDADKVFIVRGDEGGETA